MDNKVKDPRRGEKEWSSSLEVEVFALLDAEISICTAFVVAHLFAQLPIGRPVHLLNRSWIANYRAASRSNIWSLL